AHAPLYGLSDVQIRALEILGESSGRSGGLKMVRLRQRIGGLPVFQSETRLILDREGRPVRSVGRIAPGLDDTLPSLAGLLPASAAARAAGRTLGIEAEAIRPIQAEMVLFPLAPGVAVPAWSQVFLLGGPAD